MKKRVITILLCMVMVMCFVGCSNLKERNSDENKKIYQIGISQFAEHGSLDNCRKGFIKGLEEEGFIEGKNLKIKVKNAIADQGTAKQISDTFVAEDVDMICAIATPSAQSAYNSAMQTDIPVIYTAVTNPVAAKLVNKEGMPVGEVTGTSDKLPIKEQLKMIRKILPQAKKIGIMYTTSEVNSISAIKEYEKLAAQYNFTIVKKGVSQTADISLAVEELLTEVDCITNLTDNTVVNSLSTILEKANKRNIPVFGSEIEQVKLGCLSAEGLDYVELGKQTGRMAAKVLKGEKKASEMKYETISEPALYINTKVAKNMEMMLEKELIENAKEKFDIISE